MRCRAVELASQMRDWSVVDKVEPSELSEVVPCTFVPTRNGVTPRHGVHGNMHRQGAMP